MSVIITAEHFELAEETRAAIERKLSKLNRILPLEDRTLRLSLKPLKNGRFAATLQVHAEQRDWVASATGNNLLGLVTSVEAFLHRRLAATHQKRVHSRRKGVAKGESGLPQVG